MPLPTGLALVFALVLACWLWPARAQADEPRWGHLYALTGNVTVRENPSDDSIRVRVFKAGQKVRVDFIEAGWAAVFDPKEPVRSELKALGYARLDELRTHGAPTVAQASSIEVRKPSPDAKPEVIVNGAPAPAKPVTKTEAAPARQTTKADAAPGKPQASSPAKSGAKPSAKTDKGFGEIRVPDRDLAVRASRTTESEFKKLIRPGQRVRIDFWEDGWFAVFDPQENTRDLARAWGYSRDKYLVPESAYAGPPPAAPAASPSSPAEAAPPKEQKPKEQKPKPAEEPDVGYSVIDRKTGGRKSPVTTLRVRLDLAKPPAAELLRKIVREIWKAERRKDENVQLEVYLSGMDAHGLSYATARFHDDGRLREFWWREVVLGKSGD